MDLSRAKTEEAVRSIHSRPLGDSLKHYASPYYDPVKAKEYYERTKKLKGEREKNALTTKQREVYAVSRDNLNKARSKEVEEARAAYEAKVEDVRKRSVATVQAMSNKLRSLSVTKDLPLNEIPKNATPRQRALLEKENDRIRAKAKKDNEAARKKIGESLRQELVKARETYSSGMAAIKTKYEEADKTELANIRKSVTALTKAEKRAKTKAKK